MPRSRVDVRARQAPIREHYRDDPDHARVLLRVESSSSDLGDPLHCLISSGPGTSIAGGAHSAVGGDGDVACSGELLLTALASCQEITLRMVAANIGVELKELEVSVEGDWDPRGTLGMGREFPVGLTGIRAHTRVVVAQDVDGVRAERLLRSAERYCVVLSTLRSAPEVQSSFALERVKQDETRGDGPD
jgi:uncharacterized OsmC-like protein